MAMLFLIKKMNSEFPMSRVKVRAFVVDHGARQGSDEEAQRVSKMVSNLGMFLAPAVAS